MNPLRLFTILIIFGVISAYPGKPQSRTSTKPQNQTSTVKPKIAGAGRPKFRQYPICYMPNKLKGICKKLKDCPYLWDLQQKHGQNATTKEFLQKSMLACGSNHGGVGTEEICCAPCGATHEEIGEKIIGGDNATLGMFPFMVALGYDTFDGIDFRCGGSLISDRWVVTAGHCVAGSSGEHLRIIRLGDLDIDEKVADNATTQDIPVEKPFFLYPHYNGPPATPKVANDIALIRLRYPAILGETVYPVCLPDAEVHLKNEYYIKPRRGYVSGWGQTKADDPDSRTSRLQFAEVNTIEFNSCKDKYKNVANSKIDDSIICAGNGTKDSCRYDSGGPLTITEKGKYKLIGIVSRGVGCALANYPGIYVKVAYYLNWIQNVTESAALTFKL